MSTTIVDHPRDLLNLVGQSLGPVGPMTIEQERINQFADATGDHQWIHVDPTRAADGPFGSTIAHGYLTLSLANCFLPELLQVNQVAMGVNYGAEKVRFPSPLPVNSSITATGDIISAEEYKGGVKVVIRITISAQNAERPACIVDTISIFYPE